MSSESVSLAALLSEDLVCCDLSAVTKEGIIREMSDILYSAGRVSDPGLFYQDAMARESEGSTGFEEGIAIPHAKSAAVLVPSVAIGIHRQGVEFEAEDGLPSRLFFMIASPEKGGDHHVLVLAELATRLLDPVLCEALLHCTTPQDVIELMLKTPDTPAQQEHTGPARGFLIGVTGCPAGIAHTYLAAEALERAAASLGYDIRVETNGSIGVKNSPTAEEIARADAVLVCCDKQVDMQRFAGKKVIQTGVKAPIKNAEALIREALESPVFTPDNSDGAISGSGSGSRQQKGAIYRYLMNGVSHMIPFVVTGGLLIALSLAIGGHPTPAGMQIPEGSPWQILMNVGVASFTLMIPVLAGYIAYAIGDRPALAPGFIGGWIANSGSFYGAAAGTGFIGAIIAGLLVGYFVRFIATRQYHKLIQPLVPILIAPLSGTVFIAVIFVFVIGAPVAGLMAHLTEMLTSMSTGSAVVLGLILGGMTGFDMGGPFNKVAFLFSVGMIGQGQPQFMGAMACAIPVAPLGMGLATILMRKTTLFDETELEAGKAAAAMGLVGISEGAIPFAAQDPIAVIPANMLGSMVAAVLAFSLQITDSVAHGGPVVALLGAMNHPLLALACMVMGAVVTAVTVIVLKKWRQVPVTARV